MGKKLKIFLIVVEIIAIIIFGMLALFGIGIYYTYKDVKWHDNAENLGSVILGSPMFNERLELCSPSWAGQWMSDAWEIRGIRDRECIVKYDKPDPVIDESRDQLRVYYIHYYCRLPYEIYSNPKEIYWSEMLRSGYCEVI